MDLQLTNKFFIVTGAGSGFGRAIAEQLLQEGAEVLAVARTEEVLKSFQNQHDAQKLHILSGDITRHEVQQEVIHFIASKQLSGLVVNAGGPPAGAFLELEMDAWDEAYRQVLRWKVALLQQTIPIFRKKQLWPHCIYRECFS